MRIREEPWRVVLERRLGWMGFACAFFFVPLWLFAAWGARSAIAEHLVASLPALGGLVLLPLLLSLAVPFFLDDAVRCVELTRTVEGVQLRRLQGPPLGPSRVVELVLLEPELVVDRYVSLGGHRILGVFEGTREERALRRLVAGPTWGGAAATSIRTF